MACTVITDDKIKDTIHVRWCIHNVSEISEWLLVVSAM